MYILGIESSCDDTAAAVLKNDTVVANVLTSQDAVHTKFGGVVPELASRKHLESIHPVVEKALENARIKLTDVDLIAVTRGPGLLGSLLVGFSYAKALAHVTRIPLVGVDHMAGHILSIFLSANRPRFPYIALIVSGGTSAIYLAESFTSFTCLGRTRDDAAGEAFDKVAKLLGLPYPGGPHVSKKAGSGDPSAIKFPRSWLEDDSLDFSFSGLKTAVLNYVNKVKRQGQDLNLENICASFQEAVVDVLVSKTIFAARQYNTPRIVIGGGVSANGRLRESFTHRCDLEDLEFFAPDLNFCTDNGAMIGFAGRHVYEQSGKMELDLDAYSRSPLG
ncbi:tRNA (adenosine(37)-N6)-threonylcarbamoyltransferase complex transferase subunit TsaD [Desulforhopalus singaporensis]|uniref:tRNA N6-adenosine threonylcarbamoyltransferase n=1 Tax=Desulforhopalus singaporensis TaxID=91360 RepID=A0A1H0QL85_9BACT|nr:tRNA (adenosine(37)-N6)-threonylcarbamoyltransferase complex transferase subunit TsaD [Desulforhopalus singaporensis]SDP17960.1 O-sialoglycoprotein endopeptidase [Desulforhopalus singaporensis]